MAVFIQYFTCFLIIQLNTVGKTFGAPTDLVEDPNIPFIEKAVLEIPEAEFANDPVVLRSQLKGAVSFKNLPTRKNGTTVFKQRKPSEAKEVVVISGFDDYIRRSDGEKTQQRTYVVLRKKKGDEEQYHVNYVYVRDLFPNEPTDGAITVGTTKRRIEFDNWDFRGADNSMETRLGWSVCSRSSFISCQGDPTRPFSFPVGQEPDYPDELPSNETEPDHSDVGLSNMAEPTSVLLRHDYFTDLADEFVHSWFVGTTVLFITQSALGLSPKISFQEASFLKDIKVVTAAREAKREEALEQRRKRTLEAKELKKRQAEEAEAEEEEAEPVADDTAAAAKPKPKAKPKVTITRNSKPTAGDGAAAEGDDADEEIVNVTEESDKYTINIQLKGQPGQNGADGIGYGGNGLNSGGGNNQNLPKPKKQRKPKGSGNALGKAAPDRDYLNWCLEYLQQYNVGSRSDDAVQAARHEAKMAQVSMAYQFDTSDTILTEGSDHANKLTDDGDNGSGGILAPIDGVTKFIGNVLGYSRTKLKDKNSVTSSFQDLGTRGANMWYQYMDKNADVASKAMGVGKISNDRSDLDSVFDHFLYGVFGGGVMLITDAIGSITKPLGLDPIVKPVVSMLGGVYGFLITSIPAPFKFALNLIKAGAKKLGVGGLIGMRGSSDKAGITFCLNNFDRVSRAIVQERERLLKKFGPGYQNAIMLGGRSFGSKAVRVEALGGATDDLADVDIYRPLGWRGVFTHRFDPFIGFGHCNVTNDMNLSELEKAKTPEALAIFYLQTLRTQCNPKQLAQINDLIKNKHLIMNPDQTFSVHPDSHLPKKIKLNLEELGQFSQAFELATYSKLYAEQLRNPTKDLSNPDGLIIFRAAKNLNTFALTVFQDAIHKYPIHAVKLVRNVLITLKSGFIKSLQSWQVHSVIKMNNRDEQWIVGDNILSAIATIDFLIDRFEPGVPEQTQDIFKAYEEYFESNKNRTAERMGNYILPTLGAVGLPNPIVSTEMPAPAPKS